MAGRATAKLCKGAAIVALYTVVVIPIGALNECFGTDPMNEFYEAESPGRRAPSHAR